MRAICGCVVILLMGRAVATDDAALRSLTLPARQQAKPIDFAHDVLPLLKARCAECHTNGKYKGSFSLDTRETILAKKAVVPGSSAKSELFKRITAKDETRMPGKGEPLNAKEIAILKAWIDEGLAWESGFSFKNNVYVAPLKPRRPELPPVREGRTHPIDRILDAYYVQKGVTLPTPADDVAFLRRAHFDLIGLPPTPAETEAFLKDTATDRRERLVRRLLDDRRAYADHWLTFWNDLLRNDYQGTGYIDGGRKQITTWLYRSLLETKPYDRFVRELIQPNGESDGFINGIRWRGRVNASQVREVQFAQNVSLVFLGMNLRCASCHDSFIDHWKLADSYGLAAIIADGPLEMHRCDKATGKMAEPRFPFPELGTIDAKQPKAKRLEQLAGMVTHPENGRFARTIANRIWHRLMGRGLVHPVDAMDTRPWNEDLLDYLGAYLVEQKYDVKKLIEHIATSQAYQARCASRDHVPSVDEFVFRGPEVKLLTAEQFIDAVWMLTDAAPENCAAPITLPKDLPPAPAGRPAVRAALVNADPLMRSLGRPNWEQVVTNRGDQLTTLQALDLSNGQILNDTLARGATNLLKSHPKATADELIEIVFQRALSRKATAEELIVARQAIGAKGTAELIGDLLWMVVMLPEFQLVR